MATTTLSALRNLGHFFATHPLSQDAPLRAWTRFAVWQLRSRIQSEVLFNWIGGQRLAVRRGMNGATGTIYVGLYEFADMMIPLHFLRPGDLFLDIGANVGTYTVLSSGVCRATTWAFEPDPDTLRNLRRNLEINDLNPLATVYDCALGSERGEVRFTIGLDCENQVADPDVQNARIVRQERLDDIVGAARPIMIKMDVEGSEENVLKGATALLADANLKVVELETVTPEIERILTRNQFARAYYEPYSRALSHEPIALKSSNALYVRDWSFVANRLATAKKIEVLGRSI